MLEHYSKRPCLAVKVDVDTDRGTREGVLPLVKVCDRMGLPATFLFSFGPDNTGKAIRRIFRPGFLSKVCRSNVTGNYGLRTLLNGTLLPAPHIGRRNEGVIQAVVRAGYETGIHCHDHFQWQDYLHTMSGERIAAEFAQAAEEYERIIGQPCRTAGAPGWQANERSLAVYDEAELLYGSDVRGLHPFIPACGGRVFRTPQIPTTLPTLDELLGRPEYPQKDLVDTFLHRLLRPGLHVLTIHAELEGMAYRDWFEHLLEVAHNRGVQFVSLAAVANGLAAEGIRLPVCEVMQGSIDGRSGLLAVQGAPVDV